VLLQQRLLSLHEPKGAGLAVECLLKLLWHGVLKTVQTQV
jgi:hypothetical protein